MKLYGRVEIDMLQHRVEMDTMQYREWSVRAKCRAIQLTPSRTAKTVARANPSPFRRAITAEMNKLIRDLQDRLNHEMIFPSSEHEQRLSWWRRMLAKVGITLETH